jgi:peptide/nickel transport system ATP-binding protein
MRRARPRRPQQPALGRSAPPIFITHDLALIRTITDRVVVMTEGRIVEPGAVANIFTAPGVDCTRQLLANTPSIEAALGHVAAPSG